jgi:hypothetical protein
VVHVHPPPLALAGLIVSLQSADGSRALLSDWDTLALTEQTPAASTTKPLARNQVPRLLADRFGLPGFELGPDDRIVLSATAR